MALLKVALTATKVDAEAQRLMVLPRHVGVQHMIWCESRIYDSLRDLFSGYTGGYWHFEETSNGAFFMWPEIAPDKPDGKIELCADNGNTQRVTPRTAGLVACLYAFNALCWKTEEDRHCDLYENLLDYAGDQDEAAAIRSLTD